MRSLSRQLDTAAIGFDVLTHQPSQKGALEAPYGVEARVRVSVWGRARAGVGTRVCGRGDARAAVGTRVCGCAGVGKQSGSTHERKLR